MLNKSFNERDIYNIFSANNINKEIISFDEQKIQIISFGTLNKFEGPDFKDAHVIIDGIKYNGDIEIDHDISDWRKHGHFLNPKYNKVVLHICYNNSQKIKYVISQSKRKIPTITFEQLFQEKFYNNISNNISDLLVKQQPYIYCSNLNHIIDQKQKYSILVKKGADRYNNKVKKYFNRLKELSFLYHEFINEPVIKYNFERDFYTKNFAAQDFANTEIWEQLLYESIMEALGYSQNKLMMKNLALNLPLSFIKKHFDLQNRTIFLQQAEAMLHFIAGFHRNVNHKDDYFFQIINIHKQIRLNFDFKTYRRDNWNFGKVRPQNSPFIRIAGAARILEKLFFDNLFANIIKKFNEIRSDNTLAHSLKSLFIIKAEGYWKNHSDFGIPSSEEIDYFVGAMRSDDILINVIFPIFSLYFEIFNLPNLAKRSFNLYVNYMTKSDNSVINNMAKALKFTDTSSAIIQQGFLELYKNYCTNILCYDCEIGKIVFDITDIEL
ncbi:MAG TPA: DUF2851 family protein [Ignavibacteriales bacterium]|nr:DUF2851 family protein [Ignavibacteriales bacterium]